MNQIQLTNREVVIRRGKMNPGNGDPEQAQPTSGQTITLFDSTANHNGVGSQRIGVPFSRLQLNIFSSHDSAASGVVFKSSFDGGANFRTQSSQTYTNASGPTTFDYLMKGDQVQVTYQNSGNSLTAWEFVLIGIMGDRNPGS